MNNKRNIILLLLLVGLQLFVPGKMIYDHESILKKGKVFKFKTAPVDPSDPLRGKFIRLNFDAQRFYTKRFAKWYSDQEVYASLNVDKEGFAKIINVSTTEPSSGDFLKTKIEYYSNDDSAFINFNFSFDKFYLEESKAPKAEKEFFEASRDTSATTYATVSVLNGRAVISNVFIKDIPLVREF